MMVAKDEKVYEDALTYALQNIMGRGKTSLLEAMLGLHWALAKKLWQGGKASGIEQAMNDLESLDIQDGPPAELPKGFQRPPAREKRPKKKGKK